MSRERSSAIDWQKAFADDLQQVARERPDAVKVLERHAVDGEGNLSLIISLPTEEIAATPGGLELLAQEQFVVTIPPEPFLPPRVEVLHRRFAAFPHVLSGSRLCIYLDPSSEWDPRGGAAALLERLWAWLGDAAAGKFDARTALYHAVGGVTHSASGGPTLVVRDELPERHAMAYVVARSPQRLDLTANTSAEAAALPIWYSSESLPFGTAYDLRDLARMLDDPQLVRGGHPESGCLPKIDGLLTTLKAAADRNASGTDQLFVLAVAHSQGGSPHLLAGGLNEDLADRLRQVSDATDIPTSLLLPIDWKRISDERPSVTTRRDLTRPVRHLAGARVLVWGCGGLGSWVAEFLARAGASHISLCDPGIVTGGLLVRQDYQELDIGHEKAKALAERLRVIRDDIVVAVEDGYRPEDLDDLAATFDLVIDATANLAVSRALSAISTPRSAVVAQIATDRENGYLGIATIWSPSSPQTLEEVDAQAGERVLADSQLEAYHSLWRGEAAGNQLIPTRGCSMPTFHGSAADLAAVAGTLLNLVAGHLHTAISGVHLVAMPHSGLMVPPHVFIESGLSDERAQ